MFWFFFFDDVFGEGDWFVDLKEYFVVFDLFW